MKTGIYVFLVVLTTVLAVVESGYLITSPRLFRTGSTHKLAVSLVNVNKPWVVKATLRYMQKGGTIASDKATFNDTDGTLTLQIPKDVDTGGRDSIQAKLSLTGGPEGERLVIETSERVTIDVAKKSVFIQTDKPIYKPGQTINMRVVGVDENLKPLKGKVSRVSIINPGGVRTMQWNDVDFVLGIVSLKLPLSSQPVLGDWKIEATVQGEKKTQVIAVEKYVLPKFEVTIEPPSFIGYNTKEVTATICARYTYGQPVTGKVKVLFHLEKRDSWFGRPGEGRQLLFTEEKEIKGCTDVKLTGQDFGLSGRHYYRYYSTPELIINATVTETATGVAQNATGTVTKIVRDSKKMEFLPTTPKTFKPGMAFRGQLKATQEDGGPLSGEQVTIVVKMRKNSGYWYNRNSPTEVYKKTITIPANGIVDFLVPGSDLSAESEYKSMSIQAQLKNGGVRVTHYAQIWYSPSGSYIEMERMAAPLKVGSDAKVKFNFTADNSTDSIHFHYQVVCRGVLVIQGSKDQQVNIKKGVKFIDTGAIEFTVTQNMVPSCRFLLFHVRDDRETVAANMVLNVDDTLENKVSISFADETKKPGEATRLTIAASPGSLVAVTAVDKSVHLLRGGNELTVDDAIGVLSSQDVGPGSRRSRYCGGYSWWNLWGRPSPLRRNRRSYFPRRQRDLDATKAFDDTGLIYFSDLKIATAECPTYTPYYSGPAQVGELGSGGPMGRVAQPQVGGFVPGSGALNIPKQKPAKKQKPLRVRKEFPKTWLWTEEVVSEETGKTVIQAKVPDTITSWTASAFAMSNSAGLGVSDPASLRVFQPFFVSLTLPYSVIRGEEVSIVTSVFNYMSKCLSIRLDFLGSEDYKMRSDASRKICVCANEAKSVSFTIVPKKLGQVPLTVVAKNIDSSVCKKDLEQVNLGVTDAVKRKLLVEPEGVRQEYTYSSFVCLSDESFFNDTIDITLPKNLVSGSIHAVVSTVGDLMGPALNVGSMLRLPYGCGEQNMVNFAPAIYIMKYLSSVDQLSEAVETKAKAIMQSGYQRELGYKRTDGSYSAFGNGDSSGNMWLTAFVLRSFAQARPFIFIDDEELKHTTKWITSRQGPDGCFPKVGRLFNKRLKGGVSTEATLTAYVAVSLMEMGMSPKDPVITGALDCVMAASTNLSDSYSAALFTYTFVLARDPRGLDFFKALKEKAITEGDTVHWAKEKTPEPDYRFRWCWYYRAPAADIEMTAYAVMSYVIVAEEDPSLIGEAMPIVRWLTKQRNSLGGFASTQDTCIALQALSKYASKVYSNSTELSVRYGEEDHPRFSQTFNITDDNRLVSQRAEIPSDLLPMKMPVEVQGAGCALLQADVSYNIHEVEEKPAFDLKVKVKRAEDILARGLTTETGEELCGPLEMEITATWLREDSSNMAVIDIKLVSGFQADEESLDRLLNIPALGFKRMEIEGSHVILYFDEIDRVSFSFKIYQSTIVKKTKPASVTVYDYYETHLAATEMYKIKEDLCNQEPTVPPQNCPTCLKKLTYKDMRSTLCNTKKVYAVYVGKRGDAVYTEIPKPRNTTTGGDVNITRSSNEGSMNSTSTSFQLDTPAGCKCPLLTPGSKIYAFVDGAELVPIGENTVLVKRERVNLNTLWRVLYVECLREP